MIDNSNGLWKLKDPFIRLKWSYLPTILSCLGCSPIWALVQAEDIKIVFWWHICYSGLISITKVNSEAGGKLGIWDDASDDLLDVKWERVKLKCTTAGILFEISSKEEVALTGHGLQSNLEWVTRSTTFTFFISPVRWIRKTWKVFCCTFIQSVKSEKYAPHLFSLNRTVSHGVTVIPNRWIETIFFHFRSKYLITFCPDLCLISFFSFSLFSFFFSLT